MSFFQKIAASPDEGPGNTKDCTACDNGDCRPCNGNGALNGNPNTHVPCPNCSGGVPGQCPTCVGTRKVHI